jgi:hypothetical protein
MLGQALAVEVAADEDGIGTPAGVVHYRLQLLPTLPAAEAEQRAEMDAVHAHVAPVDAHAGPHHRARVPGHAGEMWKPNLEALLHRPR